MTRAKIDPATLSFVNKRSVMTVGTMTPLISLAMSVLAYRQTVQHGGSISFGGVFLVTLLTSLLIGYVLIFLLKPLFLKMLLKKNGIDPGQKPE